MKKLVITFLLAGASQLSAHGLMHEDGTVIRTQASLQYRQNAVVPKDSPWLLPGFFLGGEAVPSEKRFSLDAASLAFRKEFQDPAFKNIVVFGEVGTHASHNEISLDELWVSVPLSSLLFTSIEIHAGQMSSITRREYDRSGPFSDAPLIEQIFFGGHQHNPGVRLNAKPFNSLSIGIEGFSGDVWPANQSKTNLFSELTLTTNKVQTRIGAWYSSGKANNRQDNRYEGDHHGGVQPSNVDYAFTGDTELAGLYGIAHIKGKIDLRLIAETVYSEQEGQIRNIESTDITSKTQGWRFTGEVLFDKLTLAAEYERFSAENHFNGGTSLFLSNSGMINQGYEPERTAISALWPLSANLKARIEVIEDNLGDQEELRFGLGLAWDHSMNWPNKN